MKSMMIKNLLTFAKAVGSHARSAGFWDHEPECTLLEWESLVGRFDGSHRFLQSSFFGADLLAVNNLTIGSNTSQSAFDVLNFVLCRRERKFILLNVDSDPMS